MRPNEPVAPEPGEAAPDLPLLDTVGQRVPLGSFWDGAPAVLVFLRYFGCPFCQRQVVQLRDDHASFQELGGRVVLVGQGTAEEGASFAERLRTPFACVVDPDRSAYRAYGLVSGRLLQVAGPAVAGTFIRANLHGETRQRGLRGGSFSQMPGTFVVDDEGVIRLAHRNRHVADNPRNQDLLDTLGRIRRTAQA